MPTTLRALRDAARLTQDELAARSGLSQGHIVSLEQGRVTNPTLATLEALARGLGVSLRKILDAIQTA